MTNHGKRSGNCVTQCTVPPRLAQGLGLVQPLLIEYCAVTQGRISRRSTQDRSSEAICRYLHSEPTAILAAQGCRSAAPASFAPQWFFTAICRYLQMPDSLHSAGQGYGAALRPAPFASLNKTPRQVHCLLKVLGASPFLAGASFFFGRTSLIASKYAL